MEIHRSTVHTGNKFLTIHGEYYRIVDRSEPEKSNELLNLINHQQEIDKIFLYAKDLYELKYQHLMKKREEIRLKTPQGSKDFHQILKYYEMLLSNYNVIMLLLLSKYNVIIKIFYQLI